MTFPAGAWCIKCGARETEPARKGCRNPIWHLPHFTGAVPMPEQKPRLPYADDDEDVA